MGVDSMSTTFSLFTEQNDLQGDDVGFIILNNCLFLFKSLKE